MIRPAARARRTNLGRCFTAILALHAVIHVRAAESTAEPVAAPLPGQRSGERHLPPPIAADASPDNVDLLLAKMLPPRSDSPADWQAGAPCLHDRGEPRILPPCIPPAPCHPAYPPYPADLVGVRGIPTCGPRYKGPCQPRLGTHDHGPLPRLHAVCDAAFDAFYR
ncbi:MAG: hypothetical protein ACKOCX_07780 [Planctomycetota bacterium]